METTTGFMGRIGGTAVRLAGALLVALLLAGALGQQAGATAMDKGSFASGCRSAGGSYVENADGSFQCNLKGGGTIKCPDTTSQCTYTPLISGAGMTVVTAVGNLQAVADPAPTRPATHTHISAAGSAKVNTRIAAAVATPTP